MPSVPLWLIIAIVAGNLLVIWAGMGVWVERSQRKYHRYLCERRSFWFKRSENLHYAQELQAQRLRRERRAS